MTTIAFKDGIIAYDSRMTRNNIILSDDLNKRYEEKGVSFFFVGCVSDFDEFMGCYFGEKPTHKIECSAFVFDNGKLFCVGFDDEIKEMFKQPMFLDIMEAMGSGEQFALAYMDTGMSAEEAVEMVKKRDVGTGGKVRTFKLDDYKKGEINENL